MSSLPPPTNPDPDPNPNPTTPPELAARIDAALRETDTLLPAEQYYEVHEILEHVWLDCCGIDKAALSGLILLASALHKVRKQRNPRAARVIYARALTRLATLDDHWRGIDLRCMERMTLAAMDNPSLPTPLTRCLTPTAE